MTTGYDNDSGLTVRRRATISRVRRELEQRLTSYWQLEVANAALVPAFVLIINGFITGGRPSLALLLTLPANVLLLLLGGLHWRAKLHQLQGQPASMDRLLPILDRAEWPARALTTVAVASACSTWLPDRATIGERVLTTAIALLAVAEHVNYFHRQVQHFDRAADLRRLLTGGGFRRAHLARDLARWRQTR